MKIGYKGFSLKRLREITYFADNVNALLMGNKYRASSTLFILCLPFLVFTQNSRLDSLYRQLKTVSSADSVALVLMDLSDLLNYDSADRAVYYAREAVRLSDESGNDTLQVNAMNRLATLLMSYNNYDEVVPILNEALRISRHTRYEWGEAVTYNHLGLYYYYKSVADSASYYYIKSAAMYKQLDMPKKMAQVYNNVGAAFYKQSRYDSALKYFLASLEIKEQILPSGGRVANDKELTASLINVGAFYYKLENYPEAIRYLGRAAKLSEKTGNYNFYTMALSNLASTFNTIDKYDSAVYYHRKVGRMAEKMNNTKMYSRFYTGMANVYQKTGDYDSSAYYFTKSLDVHKKLGDINGLAIVEIDLSELYFKMQQYDSTLYYAQQALETAKMAGSLEMEKKAYSALAKVCSEKKDYKRAFEYQKQYTKLNDSINKMSSENLIVEMQTKYETEKKNTEIQKLKIENLQSETEKKLFRIFSLFLLLIALLLVVYIWQRRRMNRLLKEKNEELQKLNDTQNRLMSIISHDLKSPLSAFFTITTTLKNKWDQLDRGKMENYLSRMLNSSIALKLQLENMLNWAIGQKRGITVSKKQINLQIILLKVLMVLQEFASEKRITLRNDIPEDFELYTDGKLLGIVFNNLVSNAIKFSDPDSEVVISAKRENGKSYIFVKDSGAGMSREQAENLFTEDNIASKHENRGTGLGLIVVRDIIRSIGGKISVESEPGKGAIFIIELGE